MHSVIRSLDECIRKYDLNHDGGNSELRARLVRIEIEQFIKTF